MADVLIEIFLEVFGELIQWGVTTAINYFDTDKNQRESIFEGHVLNSDSMNDYGQKARINEATRASWWPFFGFSESFSPFQRPSDLFMAFLILVLSYKAIFEVLPNHCRKASIPWNFQMISQVIWVYSTCLFIQKFLLNP